MEISVTVRIDDKSYRVVSHMGDYIVTKSLHPECLIMDTFCRLMQETVSKVGDEVLKPAIKRAERCCKPQVYGLRTNMILSDEGLPGRDYRD